MSTAIEIRSAVKRYGTTTALHSISLEIADNEFFTLLGPSGCGKTTLLRCIAGFEDLNEGEIRLFGRDIARLDPNHRPVNTVFQQYALFPHMTVLENVAFGLKMKGMGLADRTARAGKMLEMVHLSAFADRLPSQLSGGEKQRLAIARLLLKAPDVVVLDEATAHLDSENESAVQAALAIALQGRTSIVVAHRLSTIRQANQILVIDDGRIVQRGTHEELLATGGVYADLYHRQFAEDKS